MMADTKYTVRAVSCDGTASDGIPCVEEFEIGAGATRSEVRSAAKDEGWQAGAGTPDLCPECRASHKYRSPDITEGS